MDSYFLAETTKYLFMLFDHALVPSGHTELYVRAGQSTSAGTPDLSHADCYLAGTVT